MFYTILSAIVIFILVLVGLPFLLSVIPFYKECYEKYGYRVEAEWRNKYHRSHTLLLCRLDDVAMMKEQKKRRFLTLFFNLFSHAVLFSLQAVLFVWLKLSAAHPTAMLQAYYP